MVAPGDQGHTGPKTGIVDGKAGREVITAIHDRVHPGEQGRQGVRVDAALESFDPDLRIEGLQGLPSGVHLRHPDARAGVQDLALEVG